MSYIRKLSGIVLWLLAILLFFSQTALSKNLGIYGVDKNSPLFLTYFVDVVFVPPQSELIAAHNAAGRKVYLTLNAFGGSEGWKKFPDARPVMANGEYLDSALGGVCPTHEGWRRSRLDIVSSWLEKFRGDLGIDGIWLDFIRYPGLWEKGNPSIQDSCYCPRCLAEFQADSRIRISDEAKTVSEKADWIQANAFLPWMKWKKEQIASFAKEVKKLLRQSGGERQILLGAFLVPWRKADYNGALSFHLGQDAQLLAPAIDVFSPMVYHQMVERPVEWIGEITDYFAEMTGRAVWPIIQAEKVGGKEFGQIMEVVSRSSAKGLLVYTFSDMQDEHWPLLARYQVPENLLKNPLLMKDVDGAGKERGENTPDLPEDWHPTPAKSVQDSKFLYEEQDQGNVIGLIAGHDRQAVWSTGLPDCPSGTSYLFSADFFREDRLDAQAYPEISLWGQTYSLNTHRMVGKFQKLKAIVTCPQEYREGEKQFQFRNNSPGNTFRMRSPELLARGSGERLTPVAADSDFFPIGTYGASSDNLHEIHALGLNSAIIGMTRENIEACLSLNMHCTVAVPHDSETLLQAFAILKPLLQKGRFSYYVNDEPEIHSFPEGIAEDIQRIIKQHFPKAVTNMAIVRPQAVPFYEKAADYFMLDQYPVPHMPMAWLSESMDEAGRHVGRERLQSVIQAFGDEKHAAGGWPRMPTYEEMSCLAFLSVVHGSRGIYFFTYPSITLTETGKNDFSCLVKKLNSMKSWLQVHNDQKPVVSRMTSPNRFDPRGNPAVHCTRKEQYRTEMLVCVNTIATFTEAEIEISAERKTQWRDYYTDRPYMVADGTILARFMPYEAKVLLELK